MVEELAQASEPQAARQKNAWPRRSNSKRLLDVRQPQPEVAREIVLPPAEARSIAARAAVSLEQCYAASVARPPRSSAPGHAERAQQLSRKRR